MWESPSKLVPAKLKVGTTWETGGEGGEEYRHTVIQDGPLTIQAGSFTRAFLVKTEVRFLGGPWQKINATTWYVPGLGEVLGKDEKGATIWELVEYRFEEPVEKPAKP